MRSINDVDNLNTEIEKLNARQNQLLKKDIQGKRNTKINKNKGKEVVAQ